MYPERTSPASKAFAQYAISLMRTKGNAANADAYARARGWAHVPFIKSPIAPLDSASALMRQEASRAVVASIKPISASQQLFGFAINLPFATALPVVSLGATAGWISEAAYFPATSLSLNTDSLDVRKCGAQVILSHDLARATDDVAIELVDRELRTAVAKLQDETVFDPFNAGIPDLKPASLTHGQPMHSSFGDPALDLKWLADNFSGSWANAYFVCSAGMGAQLGAITNTSGEVRYPDAGPKGGSILGVPLLISASDMATTSGAAISLIDSSSIAVAAGEFEIDESTESDVVLTTNPTNPPNASAVAVSLWQMGLVAVRVVRQLNFALVRAGAAATITGASY